MWLIIPILIVFLAVILIRALAFKPAKTAQTPVSPVFVNGEKATGDLAAMGRCKTISHQDPALDDESEFEKFEKLLPELFPSVFKKCSFEKVGNRGILIRWKGKSPDAPSVYMSHYDVVAVEENDWEKPAFDGILDNGVLWGRGTLDTKATLNGILCAAEAMLNV